MLSSDTIRALYPRAPDAHVAAFAAQATTVLKSFGIDQTTNRLHYFLAQIGHESGGLTIMQENLNYRPERLPQVWPSRFRDPAAVSRCAGKPEVLANTVYCDRMGNGPFASGDGWRYRGRGYIQITGKDAYGLVGEKTGIDLMREPDRAFAPEHALKVACGVWAWKGANAACDAADFTALTRKINGGTIGLADRKAWLDKVRRTLGSPIPVEDQPDGPDVVAIQRKLQSLGYRELGAADGIIGPRTQAAITRFRQDRRLPNGLIDDMLLQALGLR
jgi:putative chitinase